jgi:hypothetical protein
MDFLNPLLQMISAFVMFVAAYLVLMVSVVICFAIGACVYKGGCLARAYTVRSASLDRSDTESASRLGTVLRNRLRAFRQPLRWIVGKEHVHHRPSVLG